MRRCILLESEEQFYQAQHMHHSLLMPSVASLT